MYVIQAAEMWEELDILVFIVSQGKSGTENKGTLELDFNTFQTCQARFIH